MLDIILSWIYTLIKSNYRSVYMDTKSNNRNVLIKLIEGLDATDIQLLLAFAAGYEAGKTNQKENVISEELLRHQMENNVKQV